MLEQIEALHDITISTKHISALIVDSVRPVCSVCGGTITEADRTAIVVAILISNKAEWFHDTVNCFERYLYTLAQYYGNRNEIDNHVDIMQ